MDVNVGNILFALSLAIDSSCLMGATFARAGIPAFDHHSKVEDFGSCFCPIF